MEGLISWLTRDEYLKWKLSVIGTFDCRLYSIQILTAVATSTAKAFCPVLWYSYVAVCGLPVRRPNHAPVMARFARDCLDRMRELVLSLDTTLGPGKKVDDPYPSALLLRCKLTL